MPRSRTFNKMRNAKEQFEFDFGRPDKVTYHTAFEDADGLVLRYGIDDSEINTRLGALLPSRFADLIDIALAVHLSDRLAVRHSTREEPRWHRRICTKIPVRSPSFWMRSTIKEALLAVLNHLTEDDWQLDFGARPSGRARTAEAQSHLFPQVFNEPTSVGLLSGGLDSFAGTAAAIRRHPEAHVICVSGVTNNRQGERQRQQMSHLQQLHPASLTHVRVGCWLRRADEVRQEPTRRTRGFLFLTLGGVVALMARTRELSLFENGVGALNLPFSRAELGVMTTRAVHPVTLQLMAALIGLVSEQEFRITNHAVFQTKAEMCADSAMRQVMAGIPVTFSCDAFPLRRQGPAQCGACTSCLLRRLALVNAHVPEEVATVYRYDVNNAEQSLKERHLRGIREMRWQVACLDHALQRADPWKGLVEEFPGILAAQEALMFDYQFPAASSAEKLVALYRRHCAEWHHFDQQDTPVAPKKAA
jgi:7-cyano-7-deazaguanine synthase in queuosine biosynthesis